MKKSLILIILLLALIPLVSAQEGNFSADSGFNWLLTKGDEGNYNNDIFTSALAGLAFRDAGAYLQAEQALDYILTQESTNYCYPKSGCTIKDTSLALFLEYKMDQETANVEKWLNSAQTTTTTTGNWWLQIATQENGTCKLSYLKANRSIEYTIKVNKGQFPDCSGSTFLDLNTCLEPNLLTNYPSLDLDVNCNTLPTIPIISIIYNSGNSYYIIDEESSSRAQLQINNGCYGSTSKSSCNLDPSLYANWIFSEIKSKTTVLPWLKNNYDIDNTIHNSLLYISTNDKLFIDKLKSLQRNDGSFEGSVYSTSVAILALRLAPESESELQQAISWLRAKQANDGSWDGNILNTAIALYAAFTSETITLPSCTNTKKDGDEEGVDCGGSCPDECGKSCFANEDCNAGYICENEMCVKQAPVGVCEENNLCEYEVWGENSENCKADCFCGDNICDNIEEASGTCSTDCGGITPPGEEITPTTEPQEQEEKSSRAWIWILLILIFLAVLGYFIYTQSKKQGGLKNLFKFGKKPSKPAAPDYRPFTSILEAREKAKESQQPPKTYRIPLKKPVAKKSKVEEELDKSLEEARKLLGK